MNNMKQGTAIYLTIAALLFINVGGILGQEGNIWTFGSGAGLDFSSGVPVPFSGAAISTNEGCSSISDFNGNLLFYTDGLTVWDQTHTQMPNGFGLLGAPSATQAALIVPKPCQSGAYYIFTVDDFFAGLHYSEVDMSLNGGLGDVISSTKNTSLLPNTAEKLTATVHGNGSGYWVITHDYGGNGFYCFEVTPAGINTTPVVTNIGTPFNGFTGGALGQMVVSPDGTKIGICNYQPLMEIFDFDNQTGVISNLTALDGEQYTYSFAFSPNSQLLYKPVPTGVNTFSTIYQYDLTAGSQSAIIASKVQVGTAASDIASMQIGPDGKIYAARWAKPDIAVINAPNVQGVGCGWVDQGVNLGGATSQGGLPNYILSLSPGSRYESSHFCLGDSTSFTLLGTACIDSAIWDFGDPASGLNSSTIFHPKHLYTDTGTFEVTLITKIGSVWDTLVDSIVIYTVPQIDLGPDQVLCFGVDSLLLNASYPGATYLWQDSMTTDSTFLVTMGGTYGVDVSVEGCGTFTDSISIGFDTIFSLNLGADDTLCDESQLLLNPGVTGVDYLWQSGSTADTFLVTNSGTYWVELENRCDTIRDSVTFTFMSPPVVDIGEDIVACDSALVTLSTAAQGGVDYVWQNDSIGPSIETRKPGQYILIGTNHCDISSDTLQLSYSSSPIVDLGMDTAFCIGDSFTLNALDSGLVEYVWQGVSGDPVFTAFLPGEYRLEVFNEAGCSGMDTVLLEGLDCSLQLIVPNVFTPNADGINDQFQIDGLEDVVSFELSIFNRWGIPVYESQTFDEGWDGAVNGEPATDGVYFYRLTFSTEEGISQQKSGSLTLLRN